MSDEPTMISFQGCVRRDGKPFVIVVFDEKPVSQLSPAEAAAMGMRALQASIEAERDAAVVLASKEMAGTTQEADRIAFGILSMIREHRGQVDPDPRNDLSPNDPRPPEGPYPDA